MKYNRAVILHFTVEALSKYLLLEASFVGNGQPVAALGATAGQYLAAVLGAHA